MHTIVQAKGRALNPATVGDGGRPDGGRAGQRNPRAALALNHGPGIVGQTLNKSHADTVRVALNHTRAHP